MNERRGGARDNDEQHGCGAKGAWHPDLLKSIHSRIERVEEQPAKNERAEHRLHGLKKQHDDGDGDERAGDVSDWSWRRREWWNLGRVICCRV